MTKGIIVPVRKVERVLSEHPDARNSDITLFIRYCETFYPSRLMVSEKTGKKAVLLRDLFLLPRGEQLARARRIVQNTQGKYLPTDFKIVKQRRINEQLWREAMRNQGTFKRL